MQRKGWTTLLSAILCSVLIAAMVLCMNGCNNKETVAPDAPASQDSDVTELGKGKSEFTLEITDPKGETTVYRIRTDKTIVGDALLEHGLIAGEEGPYGLYVKTVGDITLDYEKDGKYWAFYVDGAFASAGVDATPISVGAEYAFKAE